jgi:ankyrin repeat protein
MITKYAVCLLGLSVVTAAHSMELEADSDERHYPSHEQERYKRRRIKLYENLHQAVRAQDIDAVRDLMGHELVNLRGRHGTTALHCAAAQGNTVIAEILLKHMADSEARTKLGRLPIHLAALYGRYDMVALLLNRRPDLAHARDNEGFTPYDLAQERGQVNIAELIVARAGYPPALDSNSRLFTLLDGVSLQR